MKYFSVVLIILFFCFSSASLYAQQCSELVWSDEFSGSALDLNKWEPMIGDGCSYGICGWGNNEEQYYKAENAVVSNGTLKIIAKKERVRGKKYTSARLRTKGLADFTFGRFEARIKLLEGQGFWPAFWMLSTNEPYGGWPQSGEIDIMELIGSNPEIAHGTIHYGDPYPNNQSQGNGFELFSTSFADGFHVFAIEWEPGEIRWYIDDILYSVKTDQDVAPFNWPFDSSNQMHFLLNLAVGGNWPGNADNTTPFPSQMEVDYVRVYDSNFNPSISGDRLVPYQSTGEVYTINNAPGGATFSWNVPTGATISSGQGTNSITVDWGGTSGTITSNVTTSCISKQYNIDVVVEPNKVYEFSFENFDQAANVTLSSVTGTLTEIANPNPSGINTSATSAEYIRNSQEQYDVIAYSTSSISDASFYKDRTKKFYMDVQTNAPIGTEIILQLENSAVATPTNYPSGRHSRYVGTITKNGAWERIIFDYLDAPDGSTADNSVDTIILLFASNSFTGDTYYWDNFDSYTTDTGSGSNTAPTASYSYIATNLAVDFDGSGSSDSDGTITNYSWDFGDGNTASGQVASHTFAAAGDYSVSLTVTDDGGLTDTSTQTVSVTDGTGGEATTMFIQSNTTGTASASKGAKYGTAIVVITDNLGNPVNGAGVDGTFSGSFTENVSGTTITDGSVNFITSSTAKGGVVVNFCVDNVSHPTLTYDSNQNIVTCSTENAKKVPETWNSLSEVTEFSLLNNYPNPFNPSTNIAYTLAQDSEVILEIYNTMGQKVTTLVDQYQSKGSHTVTFNASELSSGIYIYRIQAGRFTSTKRMILLK